MGDEVPRLIAALQHELKYREPGAQCKLNLLRCNKLGMPF